MKLVMTMMVRDEADIIAPMVEHHFDQGISRAIITDNGSVDGTWNILEGLSKRFPIDLRRDFTHRKQQGKTVTQMARDAYSLYGADWVINADADEFWLGKDRNRKLSEIISDIDPALQSFSVPVFDMAGPPALAGTGLQRLVYHEPRTTEELHSVGLLAKSSPNALHVGSPTIEVAQGNHFVSLESMGNPPAALCLEVLHFPWRSWSQFARKVSNAGNAYKASPDLKPSPNHHGMRDFRRYCSGELLPHYVARSLDVTGRDSVLCAGAIVDNFVAHSYVSPQKDVTLNENDWSTLRELGELLISLEELRERFALPEHKSDFISSEILGMETRISYLKNHASPKVRKLLRKTPN